MLAEDPAVRSIRNWEAMTPCPPPQTATEHSDPRIEVAQHMVQRRHEMFPRKKAMLPSSATMPTECQTYMGYDFKSHLFQALWQVPSYAQWLNHERSEEHTSELQSLMRISYAVFCLKKKKRHETQTI